LFADDDGGFGRAFGGLATPATCWTDVQPGVTVDMLPSMLQSDSIAEHSRSKLCFAKGNRARLDAEYFD
jgi:hypothetical protein